MAGAMAHGLNQPIGIIRAISSASVSDFSSGLLDLQGARTKFEKILAQTDRLAGIIENMRAFAQGDWRQRERVELSQVVEQMCEMFADQFENRHINLECVIERAEPALMVWANPVQLQEVLINLLTNARDAVEGQPDASVHVRCWRMHDDYCAFAVQDNGPGLAPEYREQLFTPFVSTKSTEKGTGLGLFTSWRMIDSLGGHLSHEDRPGGGARFVVRLPPFAKSEAESQR
jgi:two-component system C4-dicarboxylate transport sensor histidine kinase DctB